MVKSVFSGPHINSPFVLRDISFNKSHPDHRSKNFLVNSSLLKGRNTVKLFFLQRSNGLGSLGSLHCVWARQLSVTVPVSTQVCEINGYLEEVTLQMDLQPIHRRVVIKLVA